jgi:hypothetical protein
VGKLSPVELCHAGAVDWAIASLQAHGSPHIVADVAAWTLWRCTLCTLGLTKLFTSDGVTVILSQLRQRVADVDRETADSWSTVTSLCGVLLTVLAAWNASVAISFTKEDAALITALVGRRTVICEDALQVTVLACLVLMLRQPSLSACIDVGQVLHRLTELLKWTQPLSKRLHAQAMDLLRQLRARRARELDP